MYKLLLINECAVGQKLIAELHDYRSSCKRPSLHSCWGKMNFQNVIWNDNQATVNEVAMKDIYTNFTYFTTLVCC